MSNSVTALCRPLQLSPSQKAVLMCLADYCHDDGRDWHSLAAIMAWTCLGRTTVIDAMKALESRGLIAVARSPGKNHTTLLALERIRAASESVGDPSGRRTGDEASTRPDAVPLPSGSRTCPATAPVRHPDHSRPADVPQPVRHPDAPVRQPYPKHQEASAKASVITKGKARARKISPERPTDVDQQVWDDWLTLRESKKAPVTATVLHQAHAEAEKAGMTLEAFLQVWCVRGSQGLQAEWLKPAERGAVPGRSFASTDYTAGIKAETTYQRAMRERYEQVAPSIAAKAPGAAVRPNPMDIIDTHCREVPRPTSLVGKNMEDLNELLSKSRS